MSALEYLKEKEWSMGNGQCGECMGVHEGWFNHPCFTKKEQIGHEKDCKLGLSIVELGGKTIFKGGFIPTKEQRNKADKIEKQLDDTISNIFSAEIKEFKQLREDFPEQF